MSARETPVQDFGPEWCSRRVITFAGQSDTHIDEFADKHGELTPNPHPRAGQPYDTLSLAQVFTAQPGNADKASSPAFIPSTYHDFDARNHARQREAGEFVALTGDIDTGNHSLKDVHSRVSIMCREAAYLIYASAHSRPGDMRWRVVIPLDKPADFDTWHDAQTAFFNYMERAGIDMDRALDRAGQPVYLPNVPAFHAKTGEPLRAEDGEPLYFERKTTGCNAPGLRIDIGPISSAIAEVLRKREDDERERERIRKEAEQRRANKPRGEGAPIIEDFNRENSIAQLFELYGYEQSPRHPEDWRSPNQTSESYATRIMGDKWVSLSGSDAGVGLGEKCKAGCFGDAYDLFVHFEHGGNHKDAFRTLYAERRTATAAHSLTPPPIDSEDPGWEEPPEGCDAEPVVEPQIADVEQDNTFDILTLDELETLPPPSYLVDGFIVDDGLTVFYGDPGCGKSFMTVDLAMRIAMGWEWHGQKTERTGVLYVAGEGVRGLGKRTRGWRIKHGVDRQKDIPFALMPTAAQILDREERAKLIRTIDKARDALGFDVGMVVIDTVSRSIAGSDENTQETMSAFVKACDDIRAHTGGAVIGVHHSGKDKERGMRGSTVLLGGSDAVFKVEKSELLVTLTCEKQKDDEEPAPVYFDMQKFGWPAPREDDPEHWDTTLVPTRMQSKPDATEGVSRDMIARAFGMMVDAWRAGKPLSNKPQTRTSGRYAPAIFGRKIGGESDAWKELICSWLENGNLTEDMVDNRSKMSGLRVLDAVL